MSEKFNYKETKTNKKDHSISTGVEFTQHQCDEYNKKHGTKYNYGKYVAYKKMGKLEND